MQKLQSELNAHKKKLKVKKQNAFLKQATNRNIFKPVELEQYAVMQITLLSMNFADFISKLIIFVNRVNPLRKGWRYFLNNLHIFDP